MKPLKITKSVIFAEDFDLLLPVKLLNGNTGRTTHFSASAKRRKEYEHLFRLFGLVKNPPDYRQRVVLIRVLGANEKFYDSDSLGRGNAKEIIDALTACGFWRDDNTKWLDVHYGQDDSDRTRGSLTLLQVRRIR